MACLLGQNKVAIVERWPAVSGGSTVILISSVQCHLGKVFPPFIQWLARFPANKSFFFEDWFHEHGHEHESDFLLSYWFKVFVYERMMMEIT